MTDPFHNVWHFVFQSKERGLMLGAMTKIEKVEISRGDLKLPQMMHHQPACLASKSLKRTDLTRYFSPNIFLSSGHVASNEELRGGLEIAKLFSLSQSNNKTPSSWASSRFYNLLLQHNDQLPSRTWRTLTPGKSVIPIHSRSQHDGSKDTASHSQDERVILMLKMKPASSEYLEFENL